MEVLIDSNSVAVTSYLPLTNYFIYKEKQYPFNIVIFNLFSRFFSSNQQLQQNTGIKLLEDTENDIDIPDASIKDFINYCQNKNINLTKENVLFVQKLAKKFIVPPLIKEAEDFITIHSKELVIEYLNIKRDQAQFDTNEYEEMIAIDIIEYIKNEKLILLPLPVIYRIMTKYQQKRQSESKSDYPSEIIEFLFKCLDFYGQEASILFDNFDFGKLNGTVINRLLTEYSEKFDFHFINSSYLKTVYKLESDLIEREEKMKNELDSLRDENEKMKRMMIQIGHKIESNAENKNDKIDQIFSNLNERINREIQSKNDEIKQINDRYNQLKNEMDEMKSQYERQISSQKDEFTRQMLSLSENVRRLTEKVTEQTANDQLKAKNEEENKKPSISCQFTNYSDPKGIILILGDQVSLSAGGDTNPSNPLANIKKYDDNFFYNKNPGSEKDSFILFDFGNSKKIDLYSYLLRSYGSIPNNYCQPKSWRIEGSNEKMKWDPLDRRVNDQTLNAKGSFIQHNFSCQQNHSKESRYRYIRYVQEDSWSKNYPYGIWLSYFELYGNVYYY